MERLPEDQPFGIRMEHIDGRIVLHVLFHIYESSKQEFIKIRIRHIVVLNLSSGLFHIYIVGRIGQNQIGPPAFHEFRVCLRKGGVSTDHTVSA